MKLNKLIAWMWMPMTILSLVSCETAEPEGSTNNGSTQEEAEPITTIVGHSFSFDIPEDTQNRTLNIAFVSPDWFDFAITEDGASGVTVEHMKKFYKVEEDFITFDPIYLTVKNATQATTPPYQIVENNYFVTPLTARIVYSVEEKKEISGLEVTVDYQPYTSTGMSQGSVVNHFFNPSDFESEEVYNEPPHLTLNDFRGKVWASSDNSSYPRVFYEDMTVWPEFPRWLGLDEDGYEKFEYYRATYRFDEEKHQLIYTDDKGREFYGFTPYSYDNGVYYDINENSYYSASFGDAFKGNPARYLRGGWIDRHGKELSINSNGVLEGEAAPEFPKTENRKYFYQWIVLDGGESGVYRLRYEALDISTGNHVIELTEALGTYEIRDLYKSYYDNVLVLTGLIEDSFTRVRK